jgi:ATP-dependent exoDNAse (exonuclease V) alpha subunit
VILTAPTGSAADNINGNTYHTSLGMSIGKRVNPKAPQRVQPLWAKKTILIIDEISMVDLKTLSDINNRCKIARALKVPTHQTSSAVCLLFLWEIFTSFFL